MDDQDLCANGHELTGMQMPGGQPCPVCGATGRRFVRYITDSAGGQDSIASAYVYPKTATGTATAFDPAITQPTLREHRVELLWMPPSDEDGMDTLSVYVDGELRDMGIQQDDPYGLLMELADAEETGILPPWASEGDEV